MTDFTHLDEAGRAHMVDVGGKSVSQRTAVAACIVRTNPQTLRRVRSAEIEKGDVLAASRLAGIMAAKQTFQLIPLCHPIAISSVQIDFTFEGDDRIAIQASVKAADRTGVEMEALTAASVAALTVYDMCKSADRSMCIDRLRLISKTGGKSDDFERNEQRS